MILIIFFNPIIFIHFYLILLFNLGSLLYLSDNEEYSVLISNNLKESIFLIN